MSNESEIKWKKRQEEMIKHWNERANELVGKTIKSCRYMTDEEKERLGLGHWGRINVIITFDDGTVAFPSQDDEMNGSGVLYAYRADGSEIPMPHI
jgi:hypothetical protein